MKSIAMELSSSYFGLSLGTIMSAYFRVGLTNSVKAGLTNLWYDLSTPSTVLPRYVMSLVMRLANLISSSVDTNILRSRNSSLILLSSKAKMPSNIINGDHLRRSPGGVHLQVT